MTETRPVFIVPGTPEPGEPVFVVRGKDALALEAVTAYHTACCQAGLLDQAVEVTKAIVEIVRWQRDNQSKVKLPDHVHAPAGTTEPDEEAQHKIDFVKDIEALTRLHDYLSLTFPHIVTSEKYHRVGPVIAAVSLIHRLIQHKDLTICECPGFLAAFPELSEPSGSVPDRS